MEPLVQERHRHRKQVGQRHWKFHELASISGPNDWRGYCGSCAPDVRCIHCRPEFSDENSSGCRRLSWFQRARRAATAQGSWGRVGSLASSGPGGCHCWVLQEHLFQPVEDIDQINFTLAVNFGTRLHDWRLELASIIKERLVIRFGRPAAAAQAHKMQVLRLCLKRRGASPAETACGARPAEWRLAPQRQNGTLVGRRTVQAREKALPSQDLGAQIRRTGGGRSLASRTCKVQARTRAHSKQNGSVEHSSLVLCQELQPREMLI